MGTKTITVAGGAWSNSGTWDPPGQPQNTDNVKARTQGDSGNVTIDINAACRSINLDGYHGTLTHNPLKSLTIGDGTASDTGFALKFVLDMTYTLVDPTSAPIAFVSSAPGTQTVDFAGKRTGDVTFDHPSGSWQFQPGSSHLTTGTVTLTNGKLILNDANCTWGAFMSNNSNGRTLDLGSASVTLTGTGPSPQTVWDLSTITGLIFVAGSASITFAYSTSQKVFNGGSLIYFAIHVAPRPA